MDAPPNRLQRQLERVVHRLADARLGHDLLDHDFDLLCALFGSFDKDLVVNAAYEETVMGQFVKQTPKSELEAICCGPLYRSVQ